MNIHFEIIVILSAVNLGISKAYFDAFSARNRRHLNQRGDKLNDGVDVRNNQCNGSDTEGLL